MEELAQTTARSCGTRRPPELEHPALGRDFEEESLGMQFGFNLGEREAGSALSGLRPILAGLDRLLEKAVEIARNLWRTDTVSERFRGLYIDQAEIDQILQRPAGEPQFSPAEFLWARAADGSRPKKLQELLGISVFDFAVVMIALAPEIDLRYERLYAYLQDDVTRKRPSIDLVLNLLCSSAEEKLLRRAHFAADAPLVRQKIVRLFPDTNYTQPPRLAYYLKLDEQIVRSLLGEEGLDERLLPFCSLIRADEGLEQLKTDAVVKTALRSIMLAARQNEGAVVLHFSGASKIQMRHAAAAAAFDCGSLLLAANFSDAPDVRASPGEAIDLFLRQAKLLGAIPYIEGVESLNLDLVGTAVEQSGGTVMVASKSGGWFRLRGRRVVPVDFAAQDSRQRRISWERNLSQCGAHADEPTLEALARRFRLTPEQIEEAVHQACDRAFWRGAIRSAETNAASEPEVIPDDLYAAARAQSAPDLATVARKLNPTYTWQDLVLPPDTVAQLREICQRVSHYEHVMADWGFDRKLSLGKGTSALFSGPTGTGKTMAAEVIANEVKLDLYKIDLAGVVSKYIGETEKNLDRIFAAAEGTNTILFFDEADALFGKRSEVRDSHDRYANIEISYLLQKMEQYEGIAILASNLRANVDEAFVRRLAFMVPFPFPDEASRRRIWAGIWPVTTHLADDLDLDFLAREFKLTGGNIKNIALAGAFLAAEDGGAVTMVHLLHATRREYQKLGKVLSEAELDSSRFDVQLTGR